MGGDLNGFQDIMHFMKRAGGEYPRGTRGSMSLNAAYHKEMQLIIRNIRIPLGSMVHVT